MRHNCKVFHWTTLQQTSTEEMFTCYVIKCAFCTNYIGNMIYHKFLHGDISYRFKRKNVNVMLDFVIKQYFVAGAGNICRRTYWGHRSTIVLEVYQPTHQWCHISAGWSSWCEFGFSSYSHSANNNSDIRCYEEITVLKPVDTILVMRD